MGIYPNEKKWEGITKKFISLSASTMEINEKYQLYVPDEGEMEEKDETTGKCIVHVLNGYWFLFQFWTQEIQLNGHDKS